MEIEGVCEMMFLVLPYVVY